MPAVIVGLPQRSEQMLQALKTHITRERQRKKQGIISQKYAHIFIYILFASLNLVDGAFSFIFFSFLQSKKPTPRRSARGRNASDSRSRM